MDQHFIAVQSFSHQIECFCPGSIHTELLRIEEEDIIQLTDERKYIANHGWYVMIIVDDFYSFYIALADMEKYYMGGQILSQEDIELNVNYLQFQVDQSLDQHDEAKFKLVSQQLIESKERKMKLDNYMQTDEVTMI
ncbi:hypothetical protein [Gracilibacillus salinarum]|uniref:IDEAL domain-containing protein n=1 Tax=Gracilibacillus salinarum TaxID=2932255 RepID=A0ABY4GH99_9BACI|nr:hypothetical protein [Gracilibacillus salinarum]UOQ83713.1 hypothetical protein MUN87_13210 [Gracilibacillus salinarum]